MHNLEFTVVPSIMTVPPRRGTEQSAGFDIFCPAITTAFMQRFFEKNPGSGAAIVDHVISIAPRGSVIIPTGLRFITPENEYLEVKNRSSIAAKRQLLVGAEVIDSDYTGEVFINLINVGDARQILTPGEAIAQIIHKEYKHSALKYIEPEKYTKETTRGDGALGSTNTADLNLYTESRKGT